MKKRQKRTTFEPLPQLVGINPDYFTIYNDLSPIRHKVKAHRSNDVKKRPINGFLSRQAASKMKRACNYLDLIASEKTIVNHSKKYEYKLKLVFVTLTLSDKQIHSDEYIKRKMLKLFLDNLMKRFPGLNYVWKAEKQKNGNLHFHICIDHFLPKLYVSKIWNNIQYRNGYLNKYLKNKGTKIAPSTKIEKVRDKSQLKKYMRKYMLKNFLPKKKPEMSEVEYKQLLNSFEKLKVSGKIWDCSKNLLLPAYTTYIEGLSFDTRSFLFENECIVLEKYFQVFKIENIGIFISKCGDYLARQLLEHYSKLRPEKKPICPFTIFDMDNLYKY